jgi:hypothetical protein
MSESILDEWEAQANRVGEPEDDLGMNVYWRERFLTLIDLVRKKDQALAFYADKKSYEYDQQFVSQFTGSREFPSAVDTYQWRPAEEALALTEELDEKTSRRYTTTGLS